MTPTIKTRIWDESPDTRSPFAARAIRLSGFDYFDDLIKHAGWADLIWLLFTHEPPTAQQRALFEQLAVALANPGPRDPMVHAAMCGGIGGSHPAASLMAALAVASGDQGGSADLVRAMAAWADAGIDTDQLSSALAEQADTDGTWPGFSPQLHFTPEVVRQCLDALCLNPLATHLRCLRNAEPMLSAHCGRGLSLSGVAAAACIDLGFSPEQAQAIHLLLRLPGALAHALEQSGKSYRDFPFFTLSEAPLAEPGHV
ncbi:citrate synthase family protein [Nitrogeniibacter aestuarii]|uniref:hypothetical protein n=1 Tax=Nitrogeniibacter aestuarii TaxID=2815343 RepID=UPI001E33583B|nr:hypothetical protein [Nitrogeniibacter aestuarii]